MYSRNIFSFICACQFLLAVPSFAQGGETARGDGANNGGDHRQNQAMTYFLDAGDMIYEMRRSWIPKDRRSIAVWEFFTEENQALMVEEFDPRKTEVLVRESNPNGLCGQTEQARHAMIYLARDRCDFDDKAAMTRMLFGEVAHHLGVRTSLASTYAVVLYDSYRTGVPMYGRWDVTEIDGPYIYVEDEPFSELEPITGDSNFELTYLEIIDRGVGYEPSLNTDFEITYSGHHVQEQSVAVRFFDHRYDEEELNRTEGRFVQQAQFKWRNSIYRVLFTGEADPDGESLSVEVRVPWHIRPTYGSRVGVDDWLVFRMKLERSQPSDDAEGL